MKQQLREFRNDMNDVVHWRRLLVKVTATTVYDTVKCVAAVTRQTLAWLTWVVL